jgi:DNA-binding MarR family transcriptional regulator
MTAPIDDVLMALRRVIRATDIHSKFLSKTAGLTAPQLLVLQVLDKEGSATIGDIGRTICLGQATVTTIITRLESRGYVRREKSDADRRKVYVELTEPGREILASAPTPLQEKFIRQFVSLQDWEQSIILSALQRVALMMDAQDLDAAPVLDVGELDRGIDEKGG